MEQLQHEGVRTGLCQRNDGRVAEGRIGVVDHRLELVCRNFAAGETVENLEGDILVGLAAQVADFLFRHGRPFARHVKPAIAAKACQKRVAKTKRRGRTPGRYIFHEIVPYPLPM